VFVDAGGDVGAVAVAEGDLAEQEVLFELAPLVAGGGALLGAVAQLATVLDERFVGGDEEFREHRLWRRQISKPSEWVCWSGIEVPVSAVGRRDEDLAVADLPFAHARLGSN
jgi:hypothetical protein